MKIFLMQLVTISAFLVLIPLFANAEVPQYEISIKDHIFTPAEVKIPADEKIKLIVKNLDSTPEEFESHDLNREKLVTGNGQIVIFIGPLATGEYGFFGEFNPETAKGKIIVE